ncbi:MAG: hypothetical protein ABRQ39_31935, partial [Candidatus Eremiobacterota bacterium]
MQEDNKETKIKRYYRMPLDTEIIIPSDRIPAKRGGAIEFNIKKEERETGLALNIRNRTMPHLEASGKYFLTFTLINRLKDTGVDRDEKCFYQVWFRISAVDSTECFEHCQEKPPVLDNDDERSVRLLYRNELTFTTGHGCAPGWVEGKNKRAVSISAEVMPVYEIKPIVPARFDDIRLRMYDMSDYGNTDFMIENLHRICSKYAEWIENKEKYVSNEFKEEFYETAVRHISLCKKCFVRMKDGIKLIETDDRVRRAFMLMNRAMLSQQIRYGLNLRKWKKQDKNDFTVAGVREPDLHSPSTWPDFSHDKKINTRYGSWRPFQIAFILMNIPSIADPFNRERGTVELLWFPTGGGKTEAYLGLTAFSIFLRRLNDQDDEGTSVLMRYTLRLLTAQQFQRAASLICACEKIRMENIAELGEKRITLGLWVGSGLTPNKIQDAVTAFNKLTSGQPSENPFIILKCPWCGAQMGFLKESGR